MVKSLEGITARFISFWWGDNGFLSLLVLLLFSVFCAPVFDDILGQILISLFFSLLLLSGVYEVSSHIAPRILAGMVAVTAIALRWLQNVFPSLELSYWLLSLSLVYFLLLTWVVLRRVYQDGPVASKRLRWALVAYILLAITWSYIYQLIELRLPGSFIISAALLSQGEHSLQLNLTYFSFVTLTTLGYGDITPLHPTARIFAIMEALLGQLYPATLLARLVSLEIIGRHAKQVVIER